MTHPVSASDFCRKFGAYQRKVRAGAIPVVNHGEVTGYFISPEEYAVYQRVLSESRTRLHPSELPSYLREAIASASVDGHEHLDALMEGPKA